MLNDLACKLTGVAILSEMVSTTLVFPMVRDAKMSEVAPKIEIAPITCFSQKTKTSIKLTQEQDKIFPT